MMEISTNGAVETARGRGMLTVGLNGRGLDHEPARTVKYLALLYQSVDHVLRDVFEEDGCLVQCLAPLAAFDIRHNDTADGRARSLAVATAMAEEHRGESVFVADDDQHSRWRMDPIITATLFA